MDLLIALPIAAAVMTLAGKATALLFAHTHSPGRHCGWSGCQAKETTR